MSGTTCADTVDRTKYLGAGATVSVSAECGGHGGAGAGASDASKLVERHVVGVLVLIGVVVIGGVRDPGTGSGNGEVVVGVVFETTVVVFVDVCWRSGVAMRRERDGNVVDLSVPEMSDNLGNAEVEGVVMSGVAGNLAIDVTNDTDLVRCDLELNGFVSVWYF